MQIIKFEISHTQKKTNIWEYMYIKRTDNTMVKGKRTNKGNNKITELRTAKEITRTLIHKHYTEN